MSRGNAEPSEYVRASEAARLLGMTAEGVRKAVWEHRLRGRIEDGPNGRRAFFVAVDAIDEFRSPNRAKRVDRVELLEMHLSMAESELRDRNLELATLRAQLDEVLRNNRSLRRAVRALADLDERSDAHDG